MSRRDDSQKSIRRGKLKSRQTGTLSRKRKLLIGLAAVVVIVLIVVIARIPAHEADNGLSPKPKTYSAPPDMMIDTSKQYTATIETGKGNLVLELFASDVPITVNNFVFLARDGFYDSTTFHRVSLASWLREDVPLATGLAILATDLKMNSPSIPMLRVRYRWLIPAPIPMAANSLSRIPLSTISMASIQYLVS